MLTLLEKFFVRLLRGTVMFTALVSFVITVGALVYAGYAKFAPEPTASLSGRFSQIRQAVSPDVLIRGLFPVDSEVTKYVSANPDNVAYSLHSASDDELFNEFNKFLDVLLGGSFESQKQFSEWLYGTNNIGISWDPSIDNKSAINEDNVNILWRSLLLDYAKRLSTRAPYLADVKKKFSFQKDNIYSDSFDRLTAPTGRSGAPFFLAWFFSNLQIELRGAANDLTIERTKMAALRLTVTPALYVAGSTYAYFILIMLLFLVISIEASLRRTAETAGGTIITDELPEPRLDFPDRFR
jgi:hypothetical protein